MQMPWFIGYCILIVAYLFIAINFLFNILSEIRALKSKEKRQPYWLSTRNRKTFYLLQNRIVKLDAPTSYCPNQHLPIKGLILESFTINFGKLEKPLLFVKQGVVDALLSCRLISTFSKAPFYKLRFNVNVRQKTVLVAL